MLIPGAPFLFELVILILVVGFFVWLIQALPFIAEPYKKIASGIVAFFFIIWLLYAVYSMFWGGGYGYHSAPVFHRG